MNKKDVICIIPARIGSKRIKRKNFKKFINKPIINHLIIKLKKFNFFSEIFITTDNTLFFKNLKIPGVTVIKRPQKFCGDYTDTKTVINITIQQIKKLGYSFDKVCCVYPTAVFIHLDKLREAKKKLTKNINYIFSAKEYPYSIYRSFYLDKKRKLKKLFNISMKKRTQDLKKTYHDAAQFYLGWRKSWEKNLEIFGKNSKFVLFSKYSTIDIDECDDWKMAELLWKNSKKLI